jgi:hypothetical protein
MRLSKENAFMNIGLKKLPIAYHKNDLIITCSFLNQFRANYCFVVFVQVN